MGNLKVFWGTDSDLRVNTNPRIRSFSFLSKSEASWAPHSTAACLNSLLCLSENPYSRKVLTSNRLSLCFCRLSMLISVRRRFLFPPNDFGVTLLLRHVFRKFNLMSRRCSSWHWRPMLLLNISLRAWSAM